MKKLWIIGHVDPPCLGYLAEILDELGIPWTQISLSKGDALPLIEEVRGVISMGGPMSAYELQNHSWIETEMAFHLKLIEAGIPFLGICLGAQILVQALGAQVKANERMEVGWLPLSSTPDLKNDPVFGHLSIPLLFQLHGDHFDLPSGATRLLSSEISANQAFRVGKTTYGIQFHPEADEAMCQEVYEEYRDQISSEQSEAILDHCGERAIAGKEFLKEVLQRLFGENSRAR
ncbi:MAG: type 1 glutamine amidotransferase [bacterium]|nr:type 1 glutamine amidotransferase [bacterium]